VRCSDLLGASDDDRESAVMFYYGYLAAKAGIRVIDVNEIDGNVRKVMDRCAAAPNITVLRPFDRPSAEADRIGFTRAPRSARHGRIRAQLFAGVVAFETIGDSLVSASKGQVLCGVQVPPASEVTSANTAPKFCAV
jgi:HdeA/HdeB family